ncbi:MAG: PAS domain S-box protein [Candidatus Methanoperedens sp.]|nr:PAS domain S-box protein [Candidatus Methanoperedens sp.]
MKNAAERKTGQLADHGKLFQAIFEQAAIGVALVSTSDGKFIKVNKKYCDITGYSEEEMCNMDFNSITYPEDMKSDFEIIELLKSGNIREFTKEKRYIHKNGEIVWVSGTVSPLWDPGNEPGYYITVVQDITQRKRVEEKLKAAILKTQNEKNKSEAIISALGDGIIIQDKNYNIVYQNKVQTDLMGEHDGELCYKVYERRDTVCEDCPVERTFNDGKIHMTERVVPNGNGLSYFDLISSPLRDPEGNIIAGVKIVRDMTEKRRAEEEVRSTKDRLQFLLDSSFAVIYTCKPFGDFGATYISENVTKVLGYMSSDFTENPLFWQDRIHPDDKERVIRALESIFESEHQILEYRFLDKNGVYMWMRDELRLIRDENNQPKEVAGYWIDITKSKQAQEERIQLLEKEHAARTDAEAARKLDRMKNMFIASTSHELRTPLNSIIGFTGILLQGWSGELNKEQKEYLEMINSSSKHLLELIIEILDISRIESGNIDMKDSVFDLRAVMDEAIRTLRTSIKEKGLDISVEMEDISIRSDRRRLLQCMMNLIGNSVKYTESGSIKISAKILENKVDISVTDTGIGIKTQDIPRLFVPFTRLESPLSMKTSGTGLGLYLTKKLVQDVLGGEIYVLSKYGGGSTFTIQIPVEFKKIRISLPKKNAGFSNIETTGRIIKSKVDI